MSIVHSLAHSVASTWHNGNGDGYLFISGIAGLATYLAVVGTEEPASGDLTAELEGQGKINQGLCASCVPGARTRRGS